MAKIHHWIVNDIRTIKSKYGGTVEQIEFINLKTKEQVKSFLDPNNRNYHVWNPVLANRDQAMIVTGIKTAVKGGKTIIDADSVPNIEWVGSKEELKDTLVDFWDKPVTTYNSLFDE